MSKILIELKNAESATMRPAATDPLIDVAGSQALQHQLAETRRSLGYHSAITRETASDELWNAMESRRLTQSDLAAKAGVKKQFLTKVFRGGNCTIDTIVRLAHALDYRVHVHLTPNNITCEWVNVIDAADSLPKPGEYFKDFGTEYHRIPDREEEIQDEGIANKP